VLVGHRLGGQDPPRTRPSGDPGWRVALTLSLLGLFGGVPGGGRGLCGAGCRECESTKSHARGEVVRLCLCEK
jgi:hypothetical protein